ncbi:hypothetical protein EV426DRAFT_709615 [Tirmania nivea]|nr:hypothetical protein EV426DRAFT_709615 [Tirmania nivea]
MSIGSGERETVGGERGRFTEEVVEAMKGMDTLLFALDPAGEQMAHAIMVV